MGAYVPYPSGVWAISPDLQRMEAMRHYPIVKNADGSMSLAGYPAFVQPDGECTHCGSKSDTLTPLTVAGGDVVLDEKLCPRCVRLLATTDAFVAI